MSSSLWVVKHSPKSLEDFVGNKQAKTAFLEWLKNWPQDKKWALLIGPPGVGKTTLVYLAADSLGMDVVEVNRENIGISVTVENLAEATTTASTLFAARHRIVLVEEAEVTLSGFSDIDRLFDVLRNTRVPVVFTINDQDALYSNRKLYPLRQAYCLQIKFEKVRTDQIQTLLSKISRAEDVKVEQDVLRDIAENAGGDVRAAINDLQAVCTGEQVVRSSDIGWVSRREPEIYAYKTVLDLIRSQSIYTAKAIVANSVADWDTIFAWLVENLPAYPKPPNKIYECAVALSSASIYAYRADRFRVYEQMKFAEDFMCYAPQTLEEKPFRKLDFPLRLKYLSKSREIRAKVGALSVLLSRHLHTSVKSYSDSDLPFLSLFAQHNKSFYGWFEHRFGEEYAKSLAKLAELGAHETVE